MSKKEYQQKVINEFTPFSEYYDEYAENGKEINGCILKYYSVSSLIDLIRETKSLQSTTSILDLGTGTALFAEALKKIKSDIKVTGVDLTTEMLRKAANKNILDEILCADLTHRFPFKDNSFDMTTISSVFEFLNGYYKHTVDEMIRVTKPKGVIAIAAKKSDELNIHDYLNNKNNLEVISSKFSPGYIITKNGNSQETPYEYIIARVN